MFLTSVPDAAPAALLHSLKHNNVLHSKKVVVTVEVANAPLVQDEVRVEVEVLNEAFVRAKLNFSYMEQPNVPRRWLDGKAGVKFDIISTSFFLIGRTFKASTHGMPLLVDQLYIAMAKAATDASSFYRLPSNRVLELGQHFTI